MSLQLFAPAATPAQRHDVVRAALSVPENVGLNAAVAESAFMHYSERLAGTAMGLASAMLQTAVLRREADDSAQETCAGGVLMASGTALTVKEDGDGAARSATAPELTPW